MLEILATKSTGRNEIRGNIFIFNNNFCNLDIHSFVFFFLIYTAPLKLLLLFVYCSLVAVAAGRGEVNHPTLTATTIMCIRKSVWSLWLTGTLFFNPKVVQYESRRVSALCQFFKNKFFINKLKRGKTHISFKFWIDFLRFLHVEYVLRIIVPFQRYPSQEKKFFRILHVLTYSISQRANF